MAEEQQLPEAGSSEAAGEDTTKNPALEAVKKELRRIRQGIRVTKITATRSIKSSRGDTFVGFSATWQSIQDDFSGPGADLMTEEDEEEALVEQGLPIRDARIARLMLACEADLAALQSARANGSISAEYYEDSVRAVRSNYDMLVLKAMKISPNDVKGPSNDVP